MKSLIYPHHKVKAGDKHERWTVLGCVFRTKTKKQSNYVCVVQCECGTVSVVGVHQLIKRLSKSCGCFRSVANLETKTRHGEIKTKLYSIWRCMKVRCSGRSSPKHKERYKDRGIKVWDKWNDYLQFREWALYSGWREDAGLEIDRIDNDKGYYPSNCRWVTRQENMNNTSTNRYLEAFGERKSARDWSRDNRCVVNYNCLILRLNRGWGIEESLTAPLGSQRPKLTYVPPSE